MFETYRQPFSILEAIASNDIEAIKHHLSDISMSCHQGTLLRAAVNANHVPVLRVLLEHQCDPDSLERGESLSPLQLAACKGRSEMVEALLEGKASVNLTTGFGSTALRIAALKGHYDACRVLLLHGADASIATVTGETALQAAKNKAIKALIASGGFQWSWERHESTPPWFRKKMLLLAMIRATTQTSTLRLIPNELLFLIFEFM